MWRKVTIASIVFLWMAEMIYAQVGQGTLKGKVVDKETGEALPFTNVVLTLNGNQVAGTQTDFDGKYTISSIPPGKYDLQVSFVGYQSVKITGVVISANQITFQDVKLVQGIELQAFEVIEYEVPLISKDQTSSGGTVTREDIQKLAGRDATSVASTVGGVYTKDDGSNSINIRGARDEATWVYIDGVKVRGSQALPKAAIEQVTVITGGLPAQYGDAIGGVISITTRGASKDFFGGAEYFTSGFKIGDHVYGLDKFGTNLLALNLSGPLLMKKDSGGKKTDPLVGFFVSTELSSEVDDRPSAIGAWRVKDEVLQSIIENPLRPSGQISGTYLNAEYTHINDFEKQAYRENVARRGINLAGKLDFNTAKNVNLTFGGSWDYRNRNEYIYEYSLFNYMNNPHRIDNTWRVFGRFTQRFNNQQEEGSENESASLIKNAYISFQVDYSKYKILREDDSHRDKLSHYGYYGKFTSQYVNFYQPTDVTGDNIPDIYEHTNWEQIALNFEYDSLINPVLANYTKRYYELYDQVEGYYDNIVNVRQGGGLLNGDFPRDIYDMWRSPGRQWNEWTRINNSQFRISAIGSAEIKDHAITFGFEFDQRDDRRYSVYPVGLWNLGRNLVNSHLAQLDKSNPIIDTTGDYWTYTYNRLYDAASQTYFDKSIRKALGLKLDGTDFIDFDSYGPEVWKIDYFSADELLNNGNSFVYYYGYDHTGKKITGRPTIDDYFNQTDENGYKKRLIPSFQPIYSAVFVQDKFAFDDLIFNVGLRVDRYDANQPVLIDQYSLFPTVKAGEVSHDKPSNIGNDYVIYVSNVSDPKVENIVGYRDPKTDRWFNKDGVEISDPLILANNDGVTPWLVDPNKRKVITDLSSASFTDYKPQINVMPRVAFSFPISDEALFFAHYDILTQRPTSGNRMDPTDYQFLEASPGNSNTNSGGIRNNPNLKPEKTIDYEIGFQQKINNFSSLKIAAFYREMRDLIQVKRLVGAYPLTYTTYANIDFGTVKGLTITYDLRRVKNVSLRASYTLQFANGTGSSTTTSFNLVNSGQPNLRTIFPLDYDQRHQITGVVDYRFAGGSKYNGPVLWGKNILEDCGANVAFRLGSGAPYTKQSNIIGYGLFSRGNTQTVGSLNGSRLPWTYGVDLKVDKDFVVEWGKENEEGQRKTANVNVYAQVLNVFNFKNILEVYPTTGNPNDDGYLSADRYQPFINGQVDPQSFRDLYTIKLQNPGYYSLPRRFRIGVMVNF